MDGISVEVGNNYKAYATLGLLILAIEELFLPAPHCAIYPLPPSSTHCEAPPVEKAFSQHALSPQPRPVGRKEAQNVIFRWSHNGHQVWTWTEVYWMKENGDIFVLSEAPGIAAGVHMPRTLRKETIE